MVRPITPVSRRFWRQVLISDDCWNWTGRLENGYGRIRLGGRGASRTTAHRYAYEALIGPIPKGLTIDHLCRNRACVNPWHLEPVSRGENVLRGKTLTATNLKKNVCPQGHIYDSVGTRINGITFRRCSKCMRDAAKRYRQKIRAA